MLDDAAARLAEDAHAVGVVHDHDRVVLACEPDDVGELREVALHREDAVRDHELAGLSRRGGKTVAQRSHVRMRVDALVRRTRQANRVDDARVVQLVGEDHRRLVGQRGDHGLVRVPAGDVAERGLRAGQVRQ